MPSPDEPAPAGLRLIALLCVLALGGYLRLTSIAEVEDLRPWPDALEYEEAARSINEGRGARLWVADEAYPPRYPPGFSLLIAATLPLVGTQLGSGIWIVLASALAAIGGAYALARIAAGVACGLVAALLVATSPLHVQWSRAVMSDVPASAAVAWLAAWLLAALRREAAARELLALGIACGLASSIRQAVLALVPAAGVVVLLLANGARRERWHGAAALAAGALLGLVPLLWFNARLFGSPLRGGYDYWVSGGTLFDAARVLGPLPTGAPGNAWYYGSLLLGDGALYPWPAAVLLLAGTVVAARGSALARALALLAWLVTGIVLALHLAFVWQWDRFLLPVLPLLAAVMALPCARGVAPLVRGAGLVLLAATLLLVHARPGSFAAPNPPAYDVATLAKIAAVTEPDAAILARTSPFFFARVLRRDADRVWVPLQLDAHLEGIRRAGLAPVESDGSDHGWIRAPLTRPFTPDAAIAAIEVLCREGRPVYLSAQLDRYVPFLAELKEALAGHFGLTQVVEPAPYAVDRVACDGAGRSAGKDR